MILIDASVWIDHIRAPDAKLALAIASGLILQHPFITAEVSLGSIKNRTRLVGMLNSLNQATPVSTRRLLEFAEEAAIHGTGIGMVDAHLLASASALDDARLWTRDKRLLRQAERLNLAYAP